MKLSKSTYEKLAKYIKNEARELEKYLFNYYFENGNKEDIIEALKNYQNEDGGFGNSLEPDFRLPDSTPLATSIGLRYISEIEGHKKAEKMVKSAINFLEEEFREKRKGWFAVNKKVNEYPHTPWWHYDNEKKMTVIDQNWGNPSVEIIAYLYKYQDVVNELDINYLLDYAIYYLKKKENFKSENEVYCYLKLYKVLPKDFQKKMEKDLANAISQVLEKNKEKWLDYVPQPLDFVSSPEDFRFGIKKSLIKDNLDFSVALLEKNGVIDPPWGKSFYKEGLEDAYEEWKGILTFKALKRLDNYNRIEK
ncbi:MAG TPA: hypothetical protein VJ881_04465 [Halanaerobiales bacterium]|nr:hypothetical protein [Halanaerobiales bacterium]